MSEADYYWALCFWSTSALPTRHRCWLGVCSNGRWRFLISNLTLTLWALVLEVWFSYISILCFMCRIAGDFWWPTVFCSNADSFFWHCRYILGSLRVVVLQYSISSTGITLEDYRVLTLLQCVLTGWQWSAMAIGSGMYVSVRTVSMQDTHEHSLGW